MFSEWRQFYKAYLYKKRNGEFFIYGWGGPESPFSKKVDFGERIGGEGILPLTMEQAKDWGTRHFDIELYEQEFGKLNE